MYVETAPPDEVTEPEGVPAAADAIVWLDIDETADLEGGVSAVLGVVLLWL